MAFWNKICGFIAIFFLCALFSSAQVSHVKSFVPQFFQKYKIKYSPLDKPNIKESIYFNKPLPVIPQNYYTQHFGIMCRKELALEKATKIPFRFRLGSLQQCNYLEGKK